MSLELPPDIARQREAQQIRQAEIRQLLLGITTEIFARAVHPWVYGGTVDEVTEETRPLSDSELLETAYQSRRAAAALLEMFGMKIRFGDEAREDEHEVA